jgi:hypothetical protein
VPRHAVLGCRVACRQVSATRQAMEAKFNSRCTAAGNVKLLEDICALRHAVAVALGHASHAHYRLTTRMAQDPGTVRPVGVCWVGAVKTKESLEREISHGRCGQVMWVDCPSPPPSSTAPPSIPSSQSRQSYHVRVIHPLCAPNLPPRARPPLPSSR